MEFDLDTFLSILRFVQFDTKVARLNGGGGHWAFPVQLYAGGESGLLGG